MAFRDVFPPHRSLPAPRGAVTCPGRAPPVQPRPRVPRVPGSPGPRPRRARCRGSTSAASATRRGSGTWSGSSRATARSWRWISRTGERGPLPGGGAGRGGQVPAGHPSLWGQGRGGRGCVARGGERGTPGFPWQRGAGPWASVSGGAGRPGSHGNGGVPAPVTGVLGGQAAGLLPPPVGSGCPLGASLCPQTPPARVSTQG